MQRFGVFFAILASVSCAPASPPIAAPAPPVAIPRLAMPERPLPNPLVPPADYQAAIERGTRTETGAPGPNYWQQRADYRILANLDVERRMLEGSAQIRYRNNSPDTLRVLALHLHQNLHLPGTLRNEPQEVTDGVGIARLAVGGRTLPAVDAPGPLREPGFVVDGTLLVVRPPAPVLPATEVSLDLDWTLEIPQSGAGRMGWDADELFFVAYWYPQMAVYDDLGGWHVDPYRGLGEFYMGYGDYDVTLTVPEGWVVRATGELQNASEVLPPEILARLARAERSDSVVRVLSPAEFGPGSATLRAQGGTLEWRFTASNVRDFTFSATRNSIWEAARAPVGDRSGDGQQEYTRVEALYRQTAPLWSEVVRYGQHSIGFLSGLTGLPYPWPHITAVEGENIIMGGMEFPMMTLMGSYTQFGPAELYAVTAHELAHMWLPMIVGTDERRYGWIDEGATNFAEAEARDDFLPGEDHRQENARNYLRAAELGIEGEIMRWTDFHYTQGAWITATYAKPAALLNTLRALIGEEAFTRAYQSFIRDWAYRHPSPWDFFGSFESAAGRDLEWFWRSWYLETWTLNHAVGNVTTDTGGTTIEVLDLGEAPMPARLTITLQDGAVLREEVPVETWLTGVRTATVTLPAGPVPVRIEIDADSEFPDIDRTNNVWTR